jgi:hypothetical protein
MGGNEKIKLRVRRTGTKKICDLAIIPYYPPAKQAAKSAKRRQTHQPLHK